jgi:hypothetical protein
MSNEVCVAIGRVMGDTEKGAWVAQRLREAGVPVHSCIAEQVFYVPESRVGEWVTSETRALVERIDEQFEDAFGR